MQYSKFFQEILDGNNLIVTKEGLAKYLPYLKQHQNGEILSFEELPELKIKAYTKSLNIIDNIIKNNTPDEASVAIIPLEGLLTRSGSWWDYGTDEIAERLSELLFNTDHIKAVILKTHCPGGTTHSIVPIEAVLTKNLKTINKPVIQAVDSIRYSAAEYIGSFCHKSFATHRMGGVGSIGVKTMVVNDDKYYADFGIKFIEIYPPESEWKDKPYREAKKGKTDLMISEELRPWALHFQNIMRKNRPSIDESVDGILGGRTFYAYDAINNGLLDGIMPFEDIVQYALDFAERQLFENF